MLAIAIPVGLLIGLALGSLGGGGSILTVPALVYLLDQSPQAATTGSLLIVGTTALVGMAAHRRAGRVRVVPGLVFGVLGIAGSYVGTRLSAGVDPHVLLTAFAALMVVAAGAMQHRTRTRHDDAGAGAVSKPPTDFRAVGRGIPAALSSSRRPAAIAIPERSGIGGPTCSLPSPSPRLSTCRAMKVVVAATVVGVLTGFFGVGGGFVIVPVLVLVLGFEMPVAVGTSLLVIAVNSAAALAARVGGHAHLDWPLLGLFTLTAIAGSVAGNRVASKVDAAKLTVAFVVLLMAVAGYTAARSVPHLI
jgi:uncharacterized membrane protein YfcA